MKESNMSSDTVTPEAGTSPLAKKSKLLAYFSENVVKTAAATIVFVGGLLTLLFFLRIGYMPDVNFESLSSLLYAVALLGIFLSAYVMALLVLPGLMLATAKEGTVNVTPAHLLVLSCSAAIIWGLLLCGLFEFLSYWSVGALCVAIALGAPWIGARSDRKFPEQLSGPTDPASEDKRWSSAKDPKKTYGWSLAALVSMVAVLSVAIVFVATIGMSGDIRRASSGHVLWVLCVLAGLIALAATAIGAVRKADAFKVAMMLAPLLFVLSLVLTGSFTALSTIAVKALGQGEIGAARIVVDGKTCGQINQTLGQRVCTESAQDEPSAICPVMLRSRIGSEVVLEFSPMAVAPAQGDKVARVYWAVTSGAVDGKGGMRWTRRVVIDKSKLLSWQPLRSFEEDDMPLPKDAPVPLVEAWLGPAAVHALGGAGEEDDAVLAQALGARCGSRLEGPVGRR